MELDSLVREHARVVYAIAYAVLRDRARAEEVAQDAFVVAWQKLPAMSPPPPLPAWICAIARNLARNAVRKRREVAMGDASDAESAGDVAAAGSTPLADALANEERAIAARALAEIGDDDREVVMLYYGGDDSHAGVARALGISEASARQRLHRATARLKSAAAAVEAAARALRPGPAFTVACIAALVAGRTVDAKAAAAAIAEADAAFPAGVPPSVSTTNASRGAVPSASTAGASPLKVAMIAGALAIAAAVAVVAAIALHDPHEGLDPRAGGDGVAPRATSPLFDDAAPARTAAAVARAAIVSHLTPAAQRALVDHLRATPALVATAKPKVYDFAAYPLVDPAPLPDPAPEGPLSKATLRYAIREVQPELAACPHPADARGTVLLHLILLGAPDSPTAIEWIIVSAEPDDAFSAPFLDCIRDTLSAIALPAMPGAERWEVDYPLAVGDPR